MISEADVRQCGKEGGGSTLAYVCGSAGRKEEADHLHLCAKESAEGSEQSLDWRCLRPNGKTVGITRLLFDLLSTSTLPTYRCSHREIRCHRHAQDDGPFHVQQGWLRQRPRCPGHHSIGKAVERERISFYQHMIGSGAFLLGGSVYTLLDIMAFQHTHTGAFQHAFLIYTALKYTYFFSMKKKGGR